MKSLTVSFRMMFLMLLTFYSGCALFRYEVIPQEKSGPHDGDLILIDERVPEYFEFVAMPGKDEWTLQIFAYDKNFKPKDISGTVRVEIRLKDGAKKEIRLWNTKKFSWSKGINHLENKIKLGNTLGFNARVTLRRRLCRTEMRFQYPPKSCLRKSCSGDVTS